MTSVLQLAESWGSIREAWRRVNAALRRQARVQQVCTPEPSVAMSDNHCVKTTETGSL